MGKVCHLYGLRQSKNFEKYSGLEVPAEFNSAQNCKVFPPMFIIEINHVTVHLVIYSSAPESIM